MPVTIYPTTLKYKNQNGQFQSATAIKGDSGAAVVVQVEGTSPTIVCEDNHRYICGEVLSLNITPPTNGVCEIIFESGSTATLLTVPNTIKWPEWFNPSILEPNATYQFKISNGLANVAIWPDEGLTGDTRVRIQKMLGVYEAPFRLIYENTITEETGTINIISDIDSNPFSLKEILVLFSEVVGTATTNAAVIINGHSTGANVTYLSISNLYNPTAQTRSAHIQVIGGRMFGEAVGTNASPIYQPVNLSTSKNASGWLECGLINEITILSLNGHKFTAGTITIYGR